MFVPKIRQLSLIVLLNCYCLILQQQRLIMKQFIKFIFFGNYFIGLLAVILSIESNVQLRLPLNSIAYYALIFCAAVFYYTYAYAGPLYSKTYINPRMQWYKNHSRHIVWSQRILFFTWLMLAAYLFFKNFNSILHLSISSWITIFIILISAVLYYGLLPKSFYTINLRKTGWLKAFIIGFVWASCANILSFIAIKVEKGANTADIILLVWLFIKNWMFCTVNAIMFDIKDYTHDSNRELKTFVVSFGVRKTIYLILLPLIVIGLFSLIAFTKARHSGAATTIINLIPFLLLLMIALSMFKQQRIMYYLIVIDGLIFLKAVCGIVGMEFINR